MSKANDCQNRRKIIVALVLGELEAQAADEIKKHIDICSDCRLLYRTLIEEEETVQSAFNAIGKRSQAIGDNIAAQFDKSSHESSSGTGVLRRLQPTHSHSVGVWRNIMKGRTAKLAAAVILIGIIVLTSIFVETNKSVVLAGVLERVEQARAYMYKMKMTTSTMPGKKLEMQGTVIISNEHGMKCEMDMGITDRNTGKTMTQQMYILPDQKVMISLMPQQKKYMRVELDDDLLARTKKQNNDPREMIKQILDCEYTELGRKEIDGIAVEGFETTDPKYSGSLPEGVKATLKVSLWVDVETWLPMLWESEVKMNGQAQAHVVLSDFQWDIPVAASDFEPVIPEDYTARTDDGYKRPSVPEKAAPGRYKSAATDHCERGEAHYLDGEYDQAFSELTRAIEIDPGFARPYITRGIAYEDKGEHDLAIADFTKLIEIKPTGSHAYRYRGGAYGNKGEYDLAVADYSKAIEIDPTIADAYIGRARVYCDKGEYDKAWKDVHEAQALGRRVYSKFLEKLRKASGRDE